MEPQKSEGAAPSKNHPEDQLLRSALYYSSVLKWQVIPLKPCTKLPLTAHGSKDGTVDAATIRGWWEAEPRANLGVVTGSASRLVVVDIDERHGGFESLAEIIKAHGEIPKTPISLTGGGGIQYFLSSPAFPVRNRTGVRPGVDIRGEGGYVVVPPSIHPSGRAYAWDLEARASETPLAAIPAWLLALITGGEATGGSRTRDWDGLAADTARGSRNQTLASLAGHLFRRFVDPKVAVLLLRAWNRCCTETPLPDEEFDRTVNSIAGREIRRRTQGADRV